MSYIYNLPQNPYEDGSIMAPNNGACRDSRAARAIFRKRSNSAAYLGSSRGKPWLNMAEDGKIHHL